mmetsp:Transcript_166281/g.534006  ORF Transcript_166281/g.534006 Transcript_166281/m.534006 type:complete len:232 (+) Transcript_166281:150-845(+)
MKSCKKALSCRAGSFFCVPLSEQKVYHAPRNSSDVRWPCFTCWTSCSCSGSFSSERGASGAAAMKCCKDSKVCFEGSGSMAPGAPPRTAQCLHQACLKSSEVLCPCLTCITSRSRSVMGAVTMSWPPPSSTSMRKSWRSWTDRAAGSRFPPPRRSQKPRHKSWPPAFLCKALTDSINFRCSGLLSGMGPAGIADATEAHCDATAAASCLLSGLTPTAGVGPVGKQTPVGSA